MEEKLEIPHHPHDHHIAYTLLLLGLICVIFAFTLLFQFLTTVRQKPLPIHRHTNEIIIEDWMTISYLTKAYKVPEYLLFEKLDTTPKDFKKSLKSLAKQKDISPQVLTRRTKNIIADFHRTRNPTVHP